MRRLVQTLSLKHLIADNAGLEGSVIINNVKNSKEGEGFDAYHETYVNMVDNGIIDPVKVTRTALEQACSVASTLLTTESAVADIKDPKADAAAAAAAQQAGY